MPNTQSQSSESDKLINIQDSIQEYQTRDISNMKINNRREQLNKSISHSLQTLYNVTTTKAMELGEGIVKKITQE